MKFTCKNYNLDIEKGLYFGVKNKYIENKNIIITGITKSDEQSIVWEFSNL